MNRLIRAILVLAAIAMPSVAFAGHSNLTVPPADTFLLGGEQGAALMVTGKNIGQTGVVIKSRVGTTDTVIAQVAPGQTFEHSFAVGEIALIANESNTLAASLSVDFTGSPSSLSMRYALPQKN
jgi:hypothetical protein